MATRALTPPDWKAAFRRSLRRALEIGGAGLLALFVLFLALALASYTHTDPSASTAAAGTDIGNWMGAPGAWASDQVLAGSASLRSCCCRCSMSPRGGCGAMSKPTGKSRSGRWWRPLALLVIAMSLLGTVLALVFDPARRQPSGRSGRPVGHARSPGHRGCRGAFRRGRLGLDHAGAGLGVPYRRVSSLVTRVFAIDWAQFLTLPEFPACVIGAKDESDPRSFTRRRV